MSTNSEFSKSGWHRAVILCEVYFRKPQKVDTLIADHASGLSRMERRRCQFLLLGVVRNLQLIEYTLSKRLKKQTRARLKSILFIGAAEILSEDPSKAPKIVHHAVEQAKNLVSIKEYGMVNAVLRKVPAQIQIIRAGEDSSVESLALIYSHPDWLVQRWYNDFGLLNTRSLLEWNQEPSPVYMRVMDTYKKELPVGLISTPWSGFYRIENSCWDTVVDIVNQGFAYIMDPASHLPAFILDLQPGEMVLDLCAAPGGKSRILAEKISNSNGRLVCLDLPGPRVELLKNNLRSFGHIPCDIVEADLLEVNPENFKLRGLPPVYDAVLIDAPCSNTGVLRRRPDTKWRLEADAINKASAKQLALLEKASDFVRPGGRLVYSTCSLEEEENQAVVKEFMLNKSPSWHLIKEVISQPWKDNHDGGAAFLFTKRD
jgi:16S rRNA (cytosine967-C5)-methyltransferase